MKFILNSYFAKVRNDDCSNLGSRGREQKSFAKWRLMGEKERDRWES